MRSIFRCSKKDDVIDIKSFIEKLITLSIRNKWFSVFHDFSGRNNQLLASHYDSLLGNHISHIIFGLGARKDGGCYIDLTDPSCNFCYFVETSINVFNSYMYSNDLCKLIGDVENIRNTLCDDDIKCAASQTQVYIEQCQSIVWSCVGILRRVKLIGSTSGIILSPNECAYMKDKYCIPFDALSQTKNYEQLFDLVLDGTIQELYTLFNMFGNDDLFSTSEIVDNLVDEMLADSNPYNWLRHIRTHFERQIKTHKLEYVFDGFN